MTYVLTYVLSTKHFECIVAEFYLNTLQVERCVNLGDVSVKRRGKNGTATSGRDPAKSTAPNSVEKKEAEDPEFSEFVAIHSKNQSGKTIWGNDGTIGTAAKNDPGAESDKEELVEDNKEAHKKDLSDLQYLKSKVVASSEPSNSVAPKKASQKTVRFTFLAVLYLNTNSYAENRRSSCPFKLLQLSDVDVDSGSILSPIKPHRGFYMRYVL